MARLTETVPATILIIAILDIILGIAISVFSLFVISDEVGVLWGTILGIVMIIAGAGLLRLLEWARQLTVTVCFLLGLIGVAYLVIMMNPLAQSDRLYGGGPSDTVIYVVSLGSIAAAYAAGRLLGKHKARFKQGWKSASGAE